MCHLASEIRSTVNALLYSIIMTSIKPCAAKKNKKKHTTSPILHDQVQYWLVVWSLLYIFLLPVPAAPAAASGFNVAPLKATKLFDYMATVVSGCTFRVLCLSLSLSVCSSITRYILVRHGQMGGCRLILNRKHHAYPSLSLLCAHGGEWQCFLVLYSMGCLLPGAQLSYEKGGGRCWHTGRDKGASFFILAKAEWTLTSAHKHS